MVETYSSSGHALVRVVFSSSGDILHMYKQNILT